MEQIFKKINRFFYGKWHIAIPDSERGRWIKEADPCHIPYLKAENANGRHILIRPLKKTECFYLLADDTDRSLILRHHMYEDGRRKPGRMVVETSPDNFQVWIHSANALSLNEKNCWLKKLCSDPAAHPSHRWGRCPGFRNRKEQYRSAGNRYPLSKLIWIGWKNLAGIPRPLSHQPRGGVCQNSDISRSDYLRDDASATDFSYALALIRRGCSDEETEQRLRAERTDWNNHSGERRKQQYLERTIRRARNIIKGR